MNMNRHIWEGWTVQTFIDELSPTFIMIMKRQGWRKPFTSKDEIREWCKDQQPYYKRSIPEVVTYFDKKRREYETK